MNKKNEHYDNFILKPQMKFKSKKTKRYSKIIWNSLTNEQNLTQWKIQYEQVKNFLSWQRNSKKLPKKNLQKHVQIAAEAKVIQLKKSNHFISFCLILFLVKIKQNKKMEIKTISKTIMILTVKVIMTIRKYWRKT